MEAPYNTNVTIEMLLKHIYSWQEYTVAGMNSYIIP